MGVNGSSPVFHERLGFVLGCDHLRAPPGRQTSIKKPGTHAGRHRAEYLRRHRQAGATPPRGVIRPVVASWRRVRPRAAISRSWRWASAICVHSPCLDHLVHLTWFSPVPSRFELPSGGELRLCIGTGRGKALWQPRVPATKWLLKHSTAKRNLTVDTEGVLASSCVSHRGWSDTGCTGSVQRQPVGAHLGEYEIRVSKTCGEAGVHRCSIVIRAMARSMSERSVDGNGPPVS